MIGNRFRATSTMRRARCYGSVVGCYLLAVLVLALASAAQAADAPSGRVLPDGTVMEDGVAVGRVVPPSKLHVEAALSDAFNAHWVPLDLFVGGSLLSPWARATVGSVDASQGVITGVAGAPGRKVLLFALAREDASQLVEQAIAVGEPSADVGAEWYQSGKLDVQVHSAITSEVVVANSSSLGDDVYLREPVSVSPNGRWVLLMASEGRRALVRAWRDGTHDLSPSKSNSLCAADLVSRGAPRLLVSGVLLKSCWWAPSGDLAACEVESPDGRRQVVLASPGDGKVTVLKDGPGCASWSGGTVYVHPYAAGDADTIIYNTSTGHSETAIMRRLEVASPATAVWADDGSAAAWLEGTDGAGLHVKTRSGADRSETTESRVIRLIGWSPSHELLGYLTDDGAMHFRVDPAADAEYELLMSGLASLSAQEATSFRRLWGVRTQTSFVHVDAPDSLVASWFEDDERPCLAYVDGAPGRGQAAYLIVFRRRPLSEQVKRGLRDSVARDLDSRTLRAAMEALRKYAAEHDGMLPPHETGAELAADLAPYLGSAVSLRGVVGSGSAGVKLLVPGADLSRLEADLESGDRSEVELAELPGAGGVRLVAVITCGESAVVTYLMREEGPPAQGR